MYFSSCLTLVYCLSIIQAVTPSYVYLHATLFFNLNLCYNYKLSVKNGGLVCVHVRRFNRYRWCKWLGSRDKAGGDSGHESRRWIASRQSSSCICLKVTRCWAKCSSRSGLEARSRQVGSGGIVVASEHTSTSRTSSFASQSGNRSCHHCHHSHASVR